MTSLLLNDVEAGLRNQVDEARAMVATPEAALAVAQRLRRTDPASTADFGSAGALAGYLRHLADHGRVDENAIHMTAPASAEPEHLWRDAWARSEQLRTEFDEHRGVWLAFCRAEQRAGRPVPELRPAPEPTQTIQHPAPPSGVAPLSSSASPSAPSASASPAARLSMAAAGARFGVRFDRLPTTATVLEALAAHGLDPRGEGDAVTLDERAVAHIAADGAAAGELVMRLVAAVRPMGYVTGGDAALR